MNALILIPQITPHSVFLCKQVLQEERVRWRLLAGELLSPLHAVNGAPVSTSAWAYCFTVQLENTQEPHYPGAILVHILAICLSLWAWLFVGMVISSVSLQRQNMMALQFFPIFPAWYWLQIVPLYPLFGVNSLENLNGSFASTVQSSALCWRPTPADKMKAGHNSFPSVASFSVVLMQFLWVRILRSFDRTVFLFFRSWFNHEWFW